jgi:hypothetical protein
MRRALDMLTADMFEIPTEASKLPGALNINTQLRALISEEIKRSPLSRYQIAARMSELTGEDISKHQLDSWTAESREGWRFPLEYLPALEVALETHAASRFIAEIRGCRLLVGRDVLVAELGKIGKQKGELARREKTLKKILGDEE